MRRWEIELDFRNLKTTLAICTSAAVKVAEILHILEYEAGFSTAELREIRSNLWSRLVQPPK